jgi:hypothetical protein
MKNLIGFHNILKFSSAQSKLGVLALGKMYEEDVFQKMPPWFWWLEFCEMNTPNIIKFGTFKEEGPEHAIPCPNILGSVIPSALAYDFSWDFATIEGTDIRGVRWEKAVLRKIFFFV